MSAFFNLEAQALAYYRDLEAAYEALVVTAPPADAPVMAWVDFVEDSAYDYDNEGEKLEGTVYKVSLAPYKVTYTTDAGAKSPVQSEIAVAPAFAGMTTVFFAQSKYPTLAAAQTAVKAMFKTVDIAIDETFSSEKNLVSFLWLPCLVALGASSIVANACDLAASGHNTICQQWFTCHPLQPLYQTVWRLSIFPCHSPCMSQVHYYSQAAQTGHCLPDISLAGPSMLT